MIVGHWCGRCKRASPRCCCCGSWNAAAGFEVGGWLYPQNGNFNGEVKRLLCSLRVLLSSSGDDDDEEDKTRHICRAGLFTHNDDTTLSLQQQASRQASQPSIARGLFAISIFHHQPATNQQANSRIVGVSLVLNVHSKDVELRSRQTDRQPGSDKDNRAIC